MHIAVIATYHKMKIIIHKYVHGLWDANEMRLVAVEKLQEKRGES